MAATVDRLPLQLVSDTHELDALMARAVRLALGPERPIDEVATELWTLAHGSTRMLDAAIGRVDRALAGEWSRTGARALASLHAARQRAGAAPPREWARPA